MAQLEGEGLDNKEKDDCSMHTMQQIPEPATNHARSSLTEQHDVTGLASSKEDVLSYEFPDLVNRLQMDLSLSADEAHILFKDTLQFLYICGTHLGKRDPFYPPRLIDEAWHTFLLFTREYDAFCRFHFGIFIHHAPVTPTNRAKHKDTPKNLVFPIANSIFGELSDNWKIEAADCPQSCCPDYDDHG
jgi:hypothetical protein